MEIAETFLPHLSGIQVDRVQLKGAAVRVQAQTVAATAACPGCGDVSRRVHSRYWRRLSDRAISGREVLIDVRVRRFFCSNTVCDKKIFAEPLPRLAGRYARRTLQAGQLLTSVGLALGGRAGARLTTVLATPVNRMTMVRVVRQVPDPPAVTPAVLGVDLSRCWDYPAAAGAGPGRCGWPWLWDLAGRHGRDNRVVVAGGRRG